MRVKETHSDSERKHNMMWLATSIKWLVIGFLGFLAMIIVSAGIIIWKFTPLVSLDKATNTISIGGGIIQIHDDQKSYHKKNDNEISPQKGLPKPIPPKANDQNPVSII